MDEMFTRGLMVGIVGGVVGGIAGGLAVLVWALLQPARTCENCGEPMPKARLPRNRRQVLWGGWTCPLCGAELDRRGRVIEA